MRHILLLALLTFLIAGFSFVKYNDTDPDEVTAACEGLSGVEKIVCLAETFKSTLSQSQINTLQLSYDLANAKKWSNLPVTFVPRLGIRLGDLNAVQFAAATELIRAAMGYAGKEGYDEVQQLWAADQYLSQNGGGSTYGSGQYYIAFLGTPSTTGTWILQTGGHHLAVCNSYSNGVLNGATPSFRAAEPFAQFTLNGATYQPMKEEQAALSAMLAGLTSTQLASAKVTSTFNDIVLGPNKDWLFPTTKVGLPCSQLNETQKNLVLSAIATYVNDIDSVSAAAYMALYSSQINETYIAYAGNAALTASKDYVRIDGPRVWIEYSVQNGIILNPTHPHSVWRDHQSDYGGLGNPSVSSTAPSVFQGAFSISPNPISGSGNAFITLESQADLRLSFYDMQGRKVAGGIALSAPGAGQYTLPLDLSACAAGNYNCVLEVQTKDGGRSVASRQISKL
jgi:hypothetical protein